MTSNVFTSDCLPLSYSYFAATTKRIISLTCVRNKKLKNAEQNTKRPFFGDESLAENTVNCQHKEQNCPSSRHESVMREWMYN